MNMGFKEDFFRLLEPFSSRGGQTELAEKTGIGQGAISKILGNGKNKTPNPGLNNVAAILDALNMTLCPRHSIDQNSADTIHALSEENKLLIEQVKDAQVEHYRLQGEIRALERRLREVEGHNTAQEAGIDTKSADKKEREVPNANTA